MNPLGKYNNSIQGPAIGDPIRISSRAPPSRTNFSLKKNKKTQMAKSVLPNGRLKTAVYKRTGDTVGVFTSTRIQILKTKEEKKNGDILKTGGILNSFLFFFFFFFTKEQNHQHFWHEPIITQRKTWSVSANALAYCHLPPPIILH